MQQYLPSSTGEISRHGRAEDWEHVSGTEKASTEQSSIARRVFPEQRFSAGTEASDGGSAARKGSVGPALQAQPPTSTTSVSLIFLTV